MNFYEILNISKTANPEEIKKAFRIKAQQYHPDKNPNNPEAERKFKEINSAYEILSNKQKKEEYDKKISPQRSWNNPEDLFTDLFGRMNHDDSNNNPFHPSQGRWHGQLKQKYNRLLFNLNIEWVNSKNYLWKNNYRVSNTYLFFNTIYLW